MRVWIVGIGRDNGDFDQYIFSSREKALDYAKRQLNKEDMFDDLEYEECCDDLEHWGNSGEMYIHYADLDDEKDFNRNEYLKGF